MTYEVVDIQDLYVTDDGKGSQEIQDYLNEAESNGWTLVHVIPEHRTWDNDNQQNGVTAAKLVMHRPTDYKEPSTYTRRGILNP